MITYNGSFAIDLSVVKSIFIEYLEPGGNLVFELNNLIIPFTYPEQEGSNYHFFPSNAFK